MSELQLDAAGRRRSPATLAEFHAGRPPRNEGMRYPADPPTIEARPSALPDRPVHADGALGQGISGRVGRREAKGPYRSSPPPI